MDVQCEALCPASALSSLFVGAVGEFDVERTVVSEEFVVVEDFVDGVPVTAFDGGSVRGGELVESRHSNRSPPWGVRNHDHEPRRRRCRELRVGYFQFWMYLVNTAEFWWNVSSGNLP